MAAYGEVLMRITLFVICLTFCAGFLHGKEWPGKPSVWKGFQRYDFQVDGRACHVVLPKKAALGNPLVWRARFPNYHPEVDLLLLERGFHIAFINTNGMFGSPRALDHWDQFYEYMTQKQELAEKVVLEAVSRGGLFAYRWAARHPSRVACIYADVPVCDFKSWPLKWGKGNAKLARQVFDQYDLSKEQAMTFKGNPVDDLAPIAKAKIPLLHIVALNDKVVPPKENTFLLAKRYRDLGGSIEIMEVEEGTEKSNGHHFTHPHPKLVADFIKKHAQL